MNLVGRSSNSMLYAHFNQDHSCISVGTRKGFFIYTCSPFSKQMSKIEGGVALCEMLFSSSLVAVVGSGEQPDRSPRKLKLYNTVSDQVIVELSYVTSVLAVRMNKKRLIVVLETKIYIYDISNMKLLETLTTPSNSKGLCALSASDNSFLAYPGATSTGEVVVYDALNLNQVGKIPAHNSALSALCLSYDGTLLATASEQGTVIRVFRVPQCQRTAVFRRGSISATIYSLGFNLSGSLLCVSSSSGTVHVFRMGQAIASTPAQLVGQYLPGKFSDILEPQRDFAQIRLSTNTPSLCAIMPSNSQLLIATAEGILYEFALDLAVGGECRMVKQYLLGDADEGEPVSAEWASELQQPPIVDNSPTKPAPVDRSMKSIPHVNSQTNTHPTSPSHIADMDLGNSNTDSEDDASI